MKNILFATAIAIALCSSCRLDNFMFNPSTDITEYKFDDYEGDLHFRLDNSYDIDDSKIHLMTLQSGPVDDRAEIYATYIGDTTTISQDTIILYCHGNAAHMDSYWQRVKLLANMGWKNRFGIMFMDYRGYGLSGGEPSEAGLYYDVDACMNWLKNKGLTNDRFVIYGFSLGTAPATELTANPRTLQPSKLILEAPFASSEYLAQDIAKLSVAGSFYINLELDNAEEIKNVEEPFLWMHGINDSYVGIHHGELVIKNYSGANLVARRIVGAEHSTVPLVMGYDNYNQMVYDFITN